MQFKRAITGTLVLAALAVGSIAPAQARGRDRYWGGYGQHRHYNRDNFSFGDAVGIAALIGAVAIVAGSVAKDRKAVQDNRPTGGRNYGEPHVDGSGDDLTNDDTAVDACAIAARDEAALKGGYAEVREIGTPQAIEGGWNIDGQVEHRAGYRDTSGETRRFTCTIRNGQVAQVYLSRDLVSN